MHPKEKSKCFYHVVLDCQYENDSIFRVCGYVVDLVGCK